MTFTRRALLSSVATIALFELAAGSRRVFGETARTFTPEAFGAIGDGRTNDTDAFDRMGRAVSAAGGGTIVLRATTYLLGTQRAQIGRGDYAYVPHPLLVLSGCTKTVSIQGNGAVLRCAPGLRYGTFDRTTGRALTPKMPFVDPAPRATPYDYMVYIERCSGGVLVENLELDGAVGSLAIGGPWGDTGWQIPAVGLYLRDNSGDEIVRNLTTHHHAQDGLMIAGSARSRPGAVKHFVKIHSASNGRQGCSIIGGSGYQFEDCIFERTGRGPVSSAPGAGIDIEAESAPIRDLRFDRCTVFDNAGCGMVADSGDSAGAVFTECRFVGTTNWSVWPSKPRFRFDRCEFVGAVVHCFGSADPAEATRFTACRFTDDPARSPNREVYRNGPMVNLSSAQNVTFDHCSFSALHGAQLPWSTGAVFVDCTMRQSGKTQAFPRGTFRGLNRIDGAVDIASSRIFGKLVFNGQTLGPR